MHTEDILCIVWMVGLALKSWIVQSLFIFTFLSVQADLQTSSQRLTLSGVSSQPASELSPGVSIDDVIHHEVKELGTHMWVTDHVIMHSICVWPIRILLGHMVTGRNFDLAPDTSCNNTPTSSIRIFYQPSTPIFTLFCQPPHSNFKRTPYPLN